MIDATLTVRGARESDLEAVLRIERASFADPWSLESFRTALDLDRMRFLVADSTIGGSADADGVGGPAQVVGYVVALLLADEAEIADIAVSPEARGSGIGGRLLDQASDDAAQRGVRSLYLEVRESNVAARALYESRSFAHVGRRRGYYQHPNEDALIMRRDLGQG